jgi:Do/DeqQ family serine protease
MKSVVIARRRGWWLLGLVIVGVLLGGVAAGSVMTARGWLPSAGNATQVPIYLAAGQRGNQEVNLNIGFAAVAKAALPAVVTVEVSRRATPQPYPFFMDPFRDFFQRDQPDQNPQRQQPESRGRLQPSGVGSGVIVSPEGYILTNNHVVEGADKVEVSLSDRRRFTAKIVGIDPPSDVAVLKVEAGNLATLPLGDSNQVEVGDVALAIGNPLGIGQTVTMGIISAKGRSTRAGSGSYEDFLQTDAAINRGNSGGALVNLRGELIGVPTQILSQTGGNIGIGFAIPTTMARHVMDQLIRDGKVRRGRLGVTVGDLTPDLAGQFGYKGTQGALVQDVEAGQAAERAGVKAGDIITELQGQRIEDSAQLRLLVAQNSPGSTIKFKIWRDGSEREMTATLAEVETAGVASRSGERGSEAPGGTLSGLRVETLTPELARRLNLPAGARGVVISQVADDSNAAEAGLRPGEVIEEVNRQPLSNVNEFNAAARQAGNRNALLRVRRADGSRFVVVRARE